MMLKRLKFTEVGVIPVLLFIAFVYALTLKGSTGNTQISQSLTNKPPFETSMERGRYAQVVSLAHRRTLNVDPFYSFLKPDIAWYNGHFYSTFPVGTALLALPFYLIGSLLGLAQVATFLSSAVFAMLTFYVIYKLCIYLNLSVRSALFAGFTYCFASSVFAYSVSLSAHPLSSLAFVLSAFALIKIWDSAISDKNYKEFFILGLLFSAQFFIDYPNLAVLLPVVVLAVIKKFVLLHKET